MYYRRGFYPRPGQADVPDDLWAEFQRIRGHLSNLDQNNVDGRTLSVGSIVPPTDIDHNGASDLLGEDNKFLYREVGHTPFTHTGLQTKNFGAHDSRWIDLGPPIGEESGLTLKAQSRGDSPWIVGASVDVRIVVRHDEKSFGDMLPNHSLFTTGGLLPAILGGGNHAHRANVRLRVRSSQGGMLAAEGVGGFNCYVHGNSVAVMAVVLSRGGPVEFSPVFQYRSIDMPTNVGVQIRKANIFAFGLYR